MRFLFTLCFLPAAFAQTQQLFGFLPNQGQFPSAVRFVRYSSNNFFYLTRDSFVVQNGIRVQIAGIDPKADLIGDSPGTAVYNFYEGRDPSRWMADMRLFAAAGVKNAYPGVNAAFTTSAGQGKVIFSVAPLADPSQIRLRVLNTGATPFQGAGGVLFAGGTVPGVFNVSARATQPNGEAAMPVTCSLKIESSDTLSIQLPDRNQSLETDVEVTFPDYDVATPPPGGGYLASNIVIPSSFGQDGSAVSNCGSSCKDALVARIDNQGDPLWVTVFGGSGDDDASFATVINDGVSATGITSSSDFPVSTAAPGPALLSFVDAYLAYFDAATGHLRTATYAGLKGAGAVAQQVVGPDGDVAIGGSSSSSGFVLRWQPAENRFLYRLTPDLPVRGLGFDASSNLYFAGVQSAGTTKAIVAGEVDSAGTPVGSMVQIGLPLATDAGSILLQAAAGNEFWIAYEIAQPSAPPAVWVARVAPAAGRLVANSKVATQGFLANVGITPSGNLKLLAQAAAASQATTPDAQLVAACPNSSSYFVVLSATVQLVYATYAGSGFDFTAQSEGTGVAPTVSCFANAAGLAPSTVAAAGELIRITGGGFGPVNPVYTALGADGKYPQTAEGFRLAIGGLNAPVIAVARGLITVQVPYESQPGQTLTLDLFKDGQLLNSIPVTISGPVFSLFDTGDRDNSLSLPALAALNQDGSVNSKDNPAAAGSVVTLFGSGLGVLSPPLQTGALGPVPPSGMLSISSLRYQQCVGCSGILYLGSAPGVSTGVIQVNVRIATDAPGSGLRVLGIGIVASDTLPGLSAYVPSGVVFIK
jgi:uncharacterized protein (TIGR03437 family)